MTEGTTEDDQFDLDALEDGGDAGSNKNFADLRKYARKMEREAKAANAKVEELSTFQTSVLEERRTAALDTVFKEVGLSPKHAALFAKVNPDADITADAVKSFAAEYELATVTGDVVAAPETEASGLTPIIKGSDTGNSQGAGGKLPSAEWLKLQGTDLAKAQQMFKAGLVDFGDAIGHDRGYVDLESQA